jgi:hypothetical protein
MAVTAPPIRIDSAEIRAALVLRGVRTLHYAASVDDACRYLRAGALLAPGDIFLDATDVHAHEHRPNKCGPVLFVLETAILATPAALDAGVCKCPPSAWPGRPAHDCWFAGADELLRAFVIGRHQEMLVLRAGGRLPFGACLAKVIVDDPCPDAPGGDGHDDAMRALQLAMAEGGVAARLESRVCAKDCGCRA